MAWSGSYYYRSVRRGNQVRRIYCGRGPAAELMATQDAQRGAERATQAQAARDEQAPWDAAESPFAELQYGLDLLVRSCLLLAGYYRHDRGEWRLRHDRNHTGTARRSTGTL